MMMSQVAEALGATLYGDDVMMSGVSKDTRDIHQGDLYVALIGERFDGHQFIDGANTAGAAGALVSEKQALDMPQVQVDDTRLALGELAAHWSHQWRAGVATGRRLIAITGSNGKTTVKEMCKKILSDVAASSAVLATKGNLNNDIGMPMMLLGLTEAHRFAVIEMGANHVGEIDYLAHIAKPDVAVVNNVGPAHLEGFGSLENIASAKAEIYNGLANDGTAVINFDDEFSALWQQRCASKKTAGFSMLDMNADVFAKKISANRYQVITSDEQVELIMPVPGKHNIMNALAAITATMAVGVSLQEAVTSLSGFENIKGRLTVIESDAGYKVIDDTYNANPLSVAAAIDVLADLSESSVLVLGDMAELGEDAIRLHAQIGSKAKRAGIKKLFATGSLSSHAVEAFGENGCYCKTKKELIDTLIKALTGSDVVLVKGSRSAAMEEVVERILTPKNNNKRVN